MDNNKKNDGTPKCLTVSFESGRPSPVAVHIVGARNKTEVFPRAPRDNRPTNASGESLSQGRATDFGRLPGEHETLFLKQINRNET